MYRAGVEGIIGLTREGDTLVIDPRIPAAWPGFSVTVRHPQGVVGITVDNPSHRTNTASALTTVEIDGQLVPHPGGPLRTTLRPGHMTLRLTLGPGAP